jgi:hypothetical protein
LYLVTHASRQLLQIKSILVWYLEQILLAHIRGR